MKTVRRLLTLALFAGAFVVAYQFGQERGAASSVSLFRWSTPPAPAWLVLALAFALGLAGGGVPLALPGDPRSRCSRAATGRSRGALEAEVHQLRNLPLAAARGRPSRRTACRRPRGPKDGAGRRRLSPRWRGLARARAGPPGRRAAEPPRRCGRRCSACSTTTSPAPRRTSRRSSREDSSQVEAYLALGPRVPPARRGRPRDPRAPEPAAARATSRAAERCLALRGLAEDFRQRRLPRQASGRPTRSCSRSAPRDARRAARAGRAAPRRAPSRAGARARAPPRSAASRQPTQEARREEAALRLEVAELAHARGPGRRRAPRAAPRAPPRPGSAAAHALLGELEVERGRSKRALAAWRRALELDRRRAPELLGKLRSAFAALGRAAEYEPFLRERLRERPDDGDARLELARVLDASAARASRAAAELRALLRRRPRPPRGRRRSSGARCAAAGRCEEACAAYAALGGAPRAEAARCGPWSGASNDAAPPSRRR